MINVADYWPIPGPGHSITKIFDNNSRAMIVPATGGGAWLEEWVNNQWTDTWHYVNSPRGILEDYDLYPNKKTAMAPGKEIIWGSHQNLGDMIQGQCKISGWGLGIGDQYGWQEVKFVSLLPTFATAAGSFQNVLQIEYWQYWTSMGAAGGRVSSGAKIWLDKRLGFIRQEWSKNGVPTGFSQALQSYSIA